MAVINKRSAEDRVLFKLRELKEVVAVSQDFTPSTYRSLALKEARELLSEFKAEVTEHLRTESAAQAQEIDELKAHVNELRDASNSVLDDYGNAIDQLEHPDEADESRELFNDLADALHKTQAQSLGAHDAAIEEEVIDRCVISVNEGIMVTNEIVMAREYGDLASTTIALTDRRIKSSIRNMPRKYNVR